MQFLINKYLGNVNNDKFKNCFCMIVSTELQSLCAEFILNKQTLKVYLNIKEEKNSWDDSSWLERGFQTCVLWNVTVRALPLPTNFYQCYLPFTVWFLYLIMSISSPLRSIVNEDGLDRYKRLVNIFIKS